MIKFKFEDQAINLPTEWPEVTVRMFVNPLFLQNDTLGLLASLSGIDRSKLLNTTEDLSPYFAKASKFLKADPLGWRGGAVPETLDLLGVTCKIPKDIELERFGQKMLLGQHLLKYDHPLHAIPDAIAIYLSPLIFAEKWDEQIDEVIEAVKELPIVDCYPIADFFLRNLPITPTNLPRPWTDQKVSTTATGPQPRTGSSPPLENSP